MKIFIIVAALSLSLLAQGPAVPPPASTAPAAIPQQPGLIQSASPEQFQGSVATGVASATPIPLSLQDAIDRALKTNLGLLVRQTGTTLAQADRRRALSYLLPNIQGSVSGTEQQIDLASFGFHFAGIPSVIGPFGYNDARAVHVADRVRLDGLEK